MPTTYEHLEIEFRESRNTIHEKNRILENTKELVEDLKQQIQNKDSAIQRLMNDWINLTQTVEALQLRIKLQQTVIETQREKLEVLGQLPPTPLQGRKMRVIEFELKRMPANERNELISKIQKECK